MKNNNQKQKTKRKKIHRGIISILTMFFIVLFAVLAISYSSVSNTNMHMSKNHRDMVLAQAAAESGLEYARLLVNRYAVESPYKSTNNIVSESDASGVFTTFSNYVQATLNATEILGNASIANPTSIKEDGRTGYKFAVPTIAFSPDKTSGFKLEVKQFDDKPDVLEIVSTGSMGDASRIAGLKYSIIKDTKFLSFSVASKSRVIVTGDSTIEKGIYSDWKHAYIAPPISLEAESTIVGDISTSMSKDDFPTDTILGKYDEIIYDQPEVDLPTADDFDTSIYKDMTKTLPNSGTKVTEYFPHADGDYTKPGSWGDAKLQRTVYGPPDPDDPPLVIKDKHLPSGANSLFRNCVFEGILYIGSGSGNGTNNVRFENCVFNGAIVTNVPAKFGPETWKKNVLYFTGESVFGNQTMEEATILAPNYNVNIGDTKKSDSGANSTLKGVVLGGVVDVRGNMEVDGTIVSMHYPDPDDWGSAAGLVATNIGFSDENNESNGNPDGVIRITPQPENMLPVGINTRYLIIPNNGTYCEF